MKLCCCATPRALESGRLALLLVAMLAGCRADHTPDTSTTAPAPVACVRPRVQKPGLSIKGAPVVVRQRLALGTAGEDALRLVLSTGEESCASLRERYPERPSSSATTLDVVLARPIDARGQAGRWGFLNAHLVDSWGERGLAALGGMVESIEVSADTAKATGLELALHDRRDGSEILYSGDLTTKFCGRVELAEKVRPQPQLEASIGALKLPIGGASVREEAGKHHLRLTRAPHGCNSILTRGYDVVIDLTLAGAPPEVTLVSLNGEALPEAPSLSLRKQHASLTLNGPGLDGKGPMALSIDADLDVHGYPLRVVGKVDALRCIATTPGAASASVASSASAVPAPSSRPSTH